MNRRHVLVGAGMMAGLWAGCAAPPRAPLQPHQWVGRLVLHIHDSPPQHHSASFELMGDAQHGELSLFNPLGATVAQARWTPTLAELRQGNQTQTYANMPSLLQTVTGAALPLDAVFDWLNGTSSTPPGWEVDLTRHAEGRVQALRSSPQPAVQLLILFQ